MATTDFQEALKLFSATVKPFYKRGVASSYRSYVTAIQTELDKLSNKPQLLEDWILPRINDNSAISVFDLLDTVKDEFDKEFTLKGISTIGPYNTSDCRSALISFAKYILGQYKANVYLALDRGDDLESCKRVARNALFCTVEVANRIKKGIIGSRTNMNHAAVNGNTKGNDYYSWFCFGFQRKKSGQTRRAVIAITAGAPDPQGIGMYVLDDNSAANEAIKKAVLEGLPVWMKTKFNDFKDYMACHIWDGTCYDYRYHTSVFNLVLLPTSVGGLSDYSTAVKELLQYEAAMRFGVYPAGQNYEMSNKTKNIYKLIHKEWRQQKEHKKVLNRIKRIDNLKKPKRSKKTKANPLPQGI